MNIDPNLHQKQGVNHLNKVLGFAPMVEEEGKATVHLTAEDWHVVADTLFHMNTALEILPKAILGSKLLAESQQIELQTENCLITIEMI
jgi:hypothetical protein